jgi:hypothetical protein
MPLASPGEELEQAAWLGLGIRVRVKLKVKVRVRARARVRVSVRVRVRVRGFKTWLASSSSPAGTCPPN